MPRAGSNFQENDPREASLRGGVDGGAAEAAPVESRMVEQQLTDLRSRISEAGQQIDTYKTKTAAAMGGGAFLLLLAAGAAYDLLKGKTSLWVVVGITHSLLAWLTGLLAGAGAALIVMACLRERRRDRIREKALAEMEQEFARLLDRRDALLKADRS